MWFRSSLLKIGSRFRDTVYEGEEEQRGGERSQYSARWHKSPAGVIRAVLFLFPPTLQTETKLRQAISDSALTALPYVPCPLLSLHTCCLYASLRDAANFLSLRRLVSGGRENPSRTDRVHLDSLTVGDCKCLQAEKNNHRLPPTQEKNK